MKKVIFCLLLASASVPAFSQVSEDDIVFTKVEKEAQFPGGADGWLKYLTGNLKADVAAKSRAPVGMHTVKVKFIVDRNGVVKDVRAVDVPADCGRCAIEAVRVLKKSPDWIPATQNGKNVNYQALQLISFVVDKEK